MWLYHQYCRIRLFQKPSGHPYINQWDRVWYYWCEYIKYSVLHQVMSSNGVIRGHSSCEAGGFCSKWKWRFPLYLHYTQTLQCRSVCYFTNRWVVRVHINGSNMLLSLKAELWQTDKYTTDNVYRSCFTCHGICTFVQPVLRFIQQYHITQPGR